MRDFLIILAVFGLILLLLRRRVHLGLTMLIASGILGIAYAIPPLRLAEVVLASIFDRATIGLILALTLIMVLENVMRRTQMLQRMTSSLAHLVGDRRIVMAAMPALLGFLPSAGGARFSAPMVEEAARGTDLTPLRQAFINFYYRHIWEFVWPLYASLIFTSQILGVSIADLIAALFPFSLMMIAGGVPLAFAGVPRLPTPAGVRRRDELLPFLISVGPIAAIVLFVLGLRIDVAVALGLVVLVLFVGHRYSPGRIWDSLRQAISPNILSLVLGVMIFRGVLTATGAVQGMPAFFADLGVAPVIVVFAIPFLLGLATGFATTPIALGFPILAGLMLTGGQLDMRLVVVGFVAGFGGIMLSPAHLCVILTAAHFKSDLLAILRRVLVPMGPILITSLVAYFLPPPLPYVLIGLTIAAFLLYLPLVNLWRGRGAQPEATPSLVEAR